MILPLKYDFLLQMLGIYVREANTSLLPEREYLKGWDNKLAS